MCSAACAPGAPGAWSSLRATLAARTRTARPSWSRWTGWQASWTRIAVAGSARAGSTSATIAATRRTGTSSATPRKNLCPSSIASSTTSPPLARPTAPQLAARHCQQMHASSACFSGRAAAARRQTKVGWQCWSGEPNRAWLNSTRWTRWARLHSIIIIVRTGRRRPACTRCRAVARLRWGRAETTVRGIGMASARIASCPAPCCTGPRAARCRIARTTCCGCPTTRTSERLIATRRGPQTSAACTRARAACAPPANSRHP
mmetsp:Transcript_45000/g.144198  ORF Transcript_45000/g.144198 Transcript_45000/m.144198 type:complete len:261 (+) Transcript_45000:752-1534(+)